VQTKLQKKRKLRYALANVVFLLFDLASFLLFGQVCDLGNFLVVKQELR
jgi:hypothetical protein